MITNEYGHKLSVVLDTMRPALQGFATAICAEYGVEDIQAHEWRGLEAAIQEHIDDATQDWAYQLQRDRKRAE